MPRLTTRWAALALVLALLTAGVAGVALAGAAGEAEPPGSIQETGQAAAGDAAGEPEAEPAQEPAATEDEERAELLARWDQLVQERRRLRTELRQVERELFEAAQELWPHEWERTRGRIRDRLEEYEERIGEYGEEIAAWIPPALVEYIAQRTGRTPEEVRELIENGQWRELLSSTANGGGTSQHDHDD